MEKTQQIDFDECYNEYLVKNPKTKKEDFLRLYVLNEKNKMITKKQVDDILKEYGIDHSIKNIEKFQCAMIHSSYLEENLTNPKFLKQIKTHNLIDKSKIKTTIPLQTCTYEKQEFRGDATIHYALTEYLAINRFPDQKEGFLTKLRMDLENGKNLSKYSISLGLSNYAIIARYLEDKRHISVSISEDIFEAFVAALKDEVGILKCCVFVENVVERWTDFSELIRNDKNYKDQLMKFCHKKKLKDPIYSHYIPHDIGEKKAFYVKAICNDICGRCMFVGEGVGQSKKDAEQMSAKDILEKQNALCTQAPVQTITNEFIVDEKDYFVPESDESDEDCSD